VVGKLPREVVLTNADNDLMDEKVDDDAVHKSS